MTTMQTMWAVGNVRTGAEIDVATRLRGDGLRVYCPRFEKFVRQRRWRRRKRQAVFRAVFPGYLFVRTDTIVDLEAVYDTLGFHYFIRNDDRLSLLRNDVIRDLRALERRGVLLPTSIESLFEQFVIGAVVKVLDGPFGGMLGVVDSEDQGRVIVKGYDFKFATELPAENLKLETG